MRSILASVVAVALLGTSAAAVAQPNGGFRGGEPLAATDATVPPSAALTIFALAMFRTLSSPFPG